MAETCENLKTFLSSFSSKIPAATWRIFSFIFNQRGDKILGAACQSTLCWRVGDDPAWHFHSSYSPLTLLTSIVSHSSDTCSLWYLSYLSCVLGRAWVTISETYLGASCFIHLQDFFALYPGSIQYIVWTLCCCLLLVHLQGKRLLLVKNPWRHLRWKVGFGSPTHTHTEPCVSTRHWLVLAAMQYVDHHLVTLPYNMGGWWRLWRGKSFLCLCSCMNVHRYTPHHAVFTTSNNMRM